MALKQIQQPPPRLLQVLEDQLGTPYGGYRFTLQWSGWFSRLADVINSNLSAGFTGTVTLAKLTSTGSNGSLTVQNGIITEVVQPS